MCTLQLGKAKCVRTAFYHVAVRERERERERERGRERGRKRERERERKRGLFQKGI